MGKMLRPVTIMLSGLLVPAINNERGVTLYML